MSELSGIQQSEEPDPAAARAEARAARKAARAQAGARRPKRRDALTQAAGDGDGEVNAVEDEAEEAAAPVYAGSPDDTPFRRAIAEYAEATASKADGGVRGRNLEIIIAADGETPRPDYVVVFHHIRKTAGSSLRRVMFDNYPGTEKVLVGTPAFLPHHELKAWYQAFFESLTPAERDSILAVASHTGNYLIHSLGRPVRAFTLVREPVDRMLSRWFFFARERPTDDFREFYETPSLHRNRSEWFNFQSRSILDAHYDTDELALSLGPPKDADLWRTRLFSVLSRHYVVGVQDCFRESLNLLGQNFGWSKLAVPQDKVNQHRPRELELDAETLRVIRAANWLDVELYQQYAGTFMRDDDAPELEFKNGAKRGYLERGYVEVESEADDPIAALREEVRALRDAVETQSLAMRLRLRSLEMAVQGLDGTPPLPAVAAPADGRRKSGKRKSGGPPPSPQELRRGRRRRARRDLLPPLDQ